MCMKGAHSGAAGAASWLALLVAVCAAPLNSSGQVAIELDVGWDPPLNSGLPDDRSATSLEPGPVFGGAAFLGDYRHEPKRWRLGLRVLTQRAVVGFMTPDPHEVAYSSTLVLVDYEAVVLKTAVVECRLDLGGGVAYFGDNIPRPGDVPFGALPELGWCLSPGVKLNVPISAAVSVHAGARGIVHEKNLEEIWPFRSGVLYVGGLEFYLPSGSRSADPEDSD